jgi:hypothetical protein
MRFPNGLARHSDGRVRNFMVLTLMTLLVGGLPLPGESNEISNRDMRIVTSFDGAGGSRLLLREIDDPSSGTRWLLVRGKTNSGGPGRLELASPQRNLGALGMQAKTTSVAQSKPQPIIRPGDKLVVEEHSATADAYLEGAALGPAWLGSGLNVRLSIGHRVVRTVAVAAGRAVLEGATEVGR